MRRPERARTALPGPPRSAHGARPDSRGPISDCSANYGITYQHTHGRRLRYEIIDGAGRHYRRHALLCPGWISDLIFFFIEKESRFVRFHAMQSVIVFGALSILVWVMGWIPFIRWFTFIIWPIQFILWVLLIYKAYQGETFKLPFAGDIAEQKASEL